MGTRDRNDDGGADRPPIKRGQSGSDRSNETRAEDAASSHEPSMRKAKEAPQEASPVAGRPDPPADESEEDRRTRRVEEKQVRKERRRQRKRALRAETRAASESRPNEGLARPQRDIGKPPESSHSQRRHSVTPVEPSLPAEPPRPSVTPVEPSLPAEPPRPSVTPVVEPSLPAEPPRPSVTPVVEPSLPAEPPRPSVTPVVEPSLPAEPPRPSVTPVEPSLPAEPPRPSVTPVEPSLPAEPPRPSVTPVEPSPAERGPSSGFPPPAPEQSLARERERASPVPEWTFIPRDGDEPADPGPEWLPGTPTLSADQPSQGQRRRLARAVFRRRSGSARESASSFAAPGSMTAEPEPAAAARMREPLPPFIQPPGPEPGTQTPRLGNFGEVAQRPVHAFLRVVTLPSWLPKKIREARSEDRLRYAALAVGSLVAVGIVVFALVRLVGADDEPHSQLPAPTAAAPITSSPSAATASPSASPPVVGGLIDRNCSDFATREAAQAFYRESGGPERDLHGLDTDRNGTACDEPSSSLQRPTAAPQTSSATATSDGP